MRRKVLSTVTTTAAIAALIFSPYPASALDPTRSADESQRHPITFLVPSDDAGAPPAESRLLNEDQAIAADEHAFIQMTLDRPDLDVTSIAVQDDGSGLSLYTTTAPAVVETIIDSYNLADYVEVKPAVHSAAELSSAMTKLTGETGLLPSGEQVAMILPALDGSRLEVILDEEKKGTGRGSLPDSGIPVEISYGSMPEAATRNVAPSTQYPQRYSGAYMQNGSLACTTGFRFTKTGGSNTPAMGSAHHCGGSGGSVQWNYSTAAGWPIGGFSGGLGSGGAAYGDTALYLGNGTQYMVPGVLTGNNTAAGSTVERIRGARASAVGGYVCYSGSRSGTVCNNRIENVSASACYGNGLPCYSNLVVTRQTTNVPAAGQGDSGGPVISQGSASGRYAMGVISGISNATTTCTGDSGGRLCSARVLYAPLNEFFGAGWGLNYYP